MSKQTNLITILSLCVLCSGCVGTGPNTQQGAVTGGAIGALAGAILGNNSSSHNSLAGALIGGTVGAIAGGTIGNSVDNQRGTLYTSEREARTQIVYSEPPPVSPAPQAEVVVAQPRPDAVWVPGFWDFNGQGYLWVPGYWAVPPAYHRNFVAAHWAYRGGHYVYYRGYWR